jgi:hypothetical protein
MVSATRVLEPISPEVSMLELLPAQASTSLQRTYRYLRLAIAGTVLIIAVAVIVTSVQIGKFLPSISAYYYTSARTAFVGALIAAGIGILALSGRGSERWLLDTAGLFAPLIAFVPTRVLPGTVAGDKGPCPAQAADCIPGSILPTVQNGVITYIAIAIAMIAIAVGIALANGTLRTRGVLSSLIVSLVVIVAVGLVGVLANPFFVYWGHLAFAGAFFLLIGIVALRNVRHFPGEIPRSTPVKWTFGILGIGMIVDVIALVWVAIDDHHPGYLIIIGEFVALGFFLVFWLLQTGRDWQLQDPQGILPLGTPPS